MGKVAADKTVARAAKVETATAGAATTTAGDVERQLTVKGQTGRSMKHCAIPFGIGRVLKTPSREG